MKIQHRPLLFFVFWTGILGWFVFRSAAQTVTWNGGGADDNWETSANWTGGLPGSTSTLSFAGTTQTTSNNNNTAGSTFAAINFASGAGAFLLTGNNLSLSNVGSSAPVLVNNSSNLQTIDINTTLSGTSNDAYINVGTGGITFNGTLNATTDPVLLNSGAGSTGTLTLTGGGTISSTASGNLTIYQGTLALDGGTYLVGSGGSGYTYIGEVNGETGTMTIAAGTTVTFGRLRLAFASGSTGIVTQSGGSVTTSILSVGNASTGSYTMGGGTLSLGSLNIADGGGGNGTFTLNGGTVSASATSEIGASTGTGTLTINGGTIDINAALDASNGTGSGTINLNGGTLGFQRISLGAAGESGTLNFNGGTLQSVGGSTKQIDSGVITVVQAGGAIIDLNSEGSVTIASAMTHASTLGTTVDGGLVVENTGGTASVLTLSGVNTFTGDTVIDGGTLTLGNSLALEDRSLNYNNQGGVFSFGSETSATLGGLKGAESLAIGSVALTVGNNNQNTTYSGTLSGVTGSLTKIGTGALTLSNANTYSGATVVNVGSLLVNGSLSSTSGVTVAATTAGNAVLGGTGTVSSSVVVGGGTGTGLSIVQPAVEGTIGTMNTGALTFSSNSKLTFDLNSNNATIDLLNITGTLTLGSGTALLSGTDLGSAVLSAGTILTLAETTMGISGFFSGYADGSDLTFGNNVYQINYGTLSGYSDDITLDVVAVPEPPLVGLLLFAAGGLMGWRSLLFRLRTA